MMEYTVENNKGKHHITIEPCDTMICIRVIRLRALGGVPKRVILELESDIGFSDAIRKIDNLCKLDEEIFSLMVEHTM